MMSSRGSNPSCDNPNSQIEKLMDDTRPPAGGGVIIRLNGEH